jgi:hypothetical protein
MKHFKGNLVATAMIVIGLGVAGLSSIPHEIGSNADAVVGGTGKPCLGVLPDAQCQAIAGGTCYVTQVYSPCNVDPAGKAKPKCQDQGENCYMHGEDPGCQNHETYGCS